MVKVSTFAAACRVENGVTVPAIRMCRELMRIIQSLRCPPSICGTLAEGMVYCFIELMKKGVPIEAGEVLRQLQGLCVSSHDNKAIAEAGLAGVPLILGLAGGPTDLTQEERGLTQEECGLTQEEWDCVASMMESTKPIVLAPQFGIGVLPDDTIAWAQDVIVNIGAHFETRED
jgi:hypothetical protein